MHELHSGDPRADDHQMVGKDLGWIGVTGGEEAVAPVGSAHGRDTRPAARAEQHGVGLEGPRPVRGVGHDGVGVDQTGRAPDHRHLLAAQDLLVGLLEVLDDGGDPLAQQFEVELPAGSDHAHAGDPPQVGHGPTGGDHGLGRDAVPEVGGTPDHVPLDEGDVDAQPGGVGGGLVAGRSAADDHEAHGHRLRPPGRGSRRRTARSGVGPRPVRGRPSLSAAKAMSTWCLTPSGVDPTSLRCPRGVGAVRIGDRFAVAGAPPGPDVGTTEARPAVRSARDRSRAGIDSGLSLTEENATLTMNSARVNDQRRRAGRRRRRTAVVMLVVLVVAGVLVLDPAGFVGDGCGGPAAGHRPVRRRLLPGLPPDVG